MSFLKRIQNDVQDSVLRDAKRSQVSHLSDVYVTGPSTLLTLPRLHSVPHAVPDTISTDSVSPIRSIHKPTNKKDKKTPEKHTKKQNNVIITLGFSTLMLPLSLFKDLG